jgi:predicted dinucleotide-binding enzyme
MKIGIFGAGNIGGNLGRRWASKGHSIRFGVPDPSKAEVAKVVAECGSNASAGDVKSAAEFGEVLVLAVPYPAVVSVVQGAGDMKGKILVDATNALRWNDGPEPAVIDTSAAQKLAEMVPGAKVV